MSRIRSVKPEFWTSAQVMECRPITRLFFIGLWNFCDDFGRISVSERKLKALIFPADEDILSANIRVMLDELSANGLIEIYTVDEKEFLQVTGWHHQKIDRPQLAKYPPKSNGSGVHVGERSSNGSDRSANARDGREGRGREKEGKGREKKEKRAGARDRSVSFDRFWAVWPNKVQKPYAEKCFAKVANEVDAIIAGVERYARSKRPDAPWLNPSTFLNQRRWEDEPGKVAQVQSETIWRTDV